MQYHISRDGKSYGPYAQPDLQRMLSQGQVLPTDLCWTEGMAGWLPISQVLTPAAPAPAPAPAAPAPAPAPAPQPQAYSPPQPQPQFQQPYSQPQAQQPRPAYTPQPQYQQPAMAMGQAGLMPPSMHWALVLVLSLVTCGIFGIAWMFIQAGFVKKIDPQSKAMQMFLGYIALILLATVFLRGSLAALTILPLVQLAAMVIFWIGAFGMRKSLTTYYNTVENCGLRLGPIMTFFFSVLYFQYHLTRIANWKRTGQLG
jgi:hypothetical protein